MTATREQDPIRASRIARLRVELIEECNGLTLDKAALEELQHCRWMEVHEGRRPSYGAIIAPAPADDLSFAGAIALPNPAAVTVGNASINELRLFADGRTSFVFRPATGPATLVFDTGLAGDEQSLASYTRQTGVTVVQRLASGRTRIFHNDHVHSCDDGSWLSRPTSARYHEAVSLRIDDDHAETAAAILDLCVHSLSPAGIGATIVWYPGGLPAGTHTVDRGAEIVPPSLAVTVSTQRPAIVHALSQLDRAVLIHSSGELAALNVTLLDPGVASELRFEGGTRHNSAGRFSEAASDAFVFVVSSDGPVTVFQTGEIIASLQAAIRIEIQSHECTACFGSGIESAPLDRTDFDQSLEVPCRVCGGIGTIESRVEVRSDAAPF